MNASNHNSMSVQTSNGTGSDPLRSVISNSTHDPQSSSPPPPTSTQTSPDNSKSKTWVQFDDDLPGSQRPAVLKTETVHVNIERSVEIPTGEPTTTPQRSVSLVATRQGFANGDVVVTLLPVNTKWPWITAAQFRPELVPEELMAQGLTLTVEEYVQAMELLVNDFRFTLYNVCYKRVLVCWILLAFIVLMALLFSGMTGLTLFSLGVVWLLLNAGAIFICMYVKLQLSKGLEKCLGRVNKQLMKHKLLLALDDRGKMSCHKVNLCFMYFDSNPCVTQLKQVIERDEGGTIPVGWERRLDVTANDIVIQGSQTTRLSQKQGLAEQAFLRYLQRWGKDFLRHRLDWTLDEDGGNPAAPRHLSQALCPCQYMEELLRNKPRRDPRACFPHCTNWLKRRGVD